MESAFIDDGMTREGRVAGEPGLHAGLTFSFRPALPEERYQFARATDLDGKAYVKRVAGVLDRHVIEWDAKDGKGQTVAKSAENIARLHPNILGKALDQVLGYTAAEAAADAKNS